MFRIVNDVVSKKQEDSGIIFERFVDIRYEDYLKNDKTKRRNSNIEDILGIDYKSFYKTI